MPVNVVISGEPMIGFASDDVFVALQPTTGTNANTVQGNDGDDLVIGDSSDLWTLSASSTNNAIGTAHNLEGIPGVWTVDENPLIQNATTIPHATAIVEATIGQREYFSVSIGAGEAITVDIDYGWGSPIGTQDDLVVDVVDGAGTVLATSSMSDFTNGGLGSSNGFFGSSSPDPYLTFVAPSAGTYYFVVRPEAGGNFTTNANFIVNISVTGHAVGAATAMGADTIYGGAGMDQLFGQGGADFIYGGADNDLIHGGSGFDTIRGGDGNDVIYSGAGDDEDVRGEAGNDTLYSDGDGHFYGGAGDDTIHAGSTDVLEMLDGGADNDTLNVTSWSGNYTINLLTGATNYSESFINFENVVTGGGNDTITGTAGANGIYTNAGVDTINAGAGADYVQAGAGNDTVNGGDGADTLFGDADNDTLDGGNDADVILGGDGVDTLYGRAANDNLNGGTGADIMYGGAGDDTYYADNASDAAFESAGGGSDEVLSTVNFSLGAYIENLRLENGGAATDGVGNILNNLIYGNVAANVLSGLAGADTLYGNLGADTLYGGFGDDELRGDADNDILDGGSDNDTLYGGGDDDTLYGRTQNDTLFGENGLDTLYGGDGNDYMSGGADADLLDGGNGADTGYGGDGADTIYGRQDNDTLYGDVGNDTLYGGDGDDAGYGGADSDTLDGGNGSDTLLGDAGSDFLYGRGGNDQLYGGLGSDFLSGGDGADAFVFSTALGMTNVDTINDFDVTQDQIYLNNAIFTTLDSGQLSANALCIGSAAADADDRIIYDPATGTLWYDADGNGPGAAIQFGVMGTGLALTAQDFFVLNLG